MIMSDRRKREIRKLMAETGMNYTRVARELDRRRTSTARRAIDSNGPIPDMDKLAQISQAADRAARFPASLPDMDKLAQISQAANFAVRFISPS
jgi:transposase-like protein